MSSPLAGFVRKETLHILRDRQTLAVLIALPLVQVLLFGFVIRTDVERARIAFVDPAPDDAGRELVARFRGTGRLEPVGIFSTTGAIDLLFERSDADAAVVLPADFGRALGEGRARIQVIVDAADPNTAMAIRAYVDGVIAEFMRHSDLVAGPQPERAGVRVLPVTRVRFNPTLESRNLFVPGLIALVLTIVSALMTSIAITREKERGTMEVLLASPLRPWQIIIGKTIPYLALASVNVVSALLAAWLIFRVPFRGSVTLLLFESLLYIIVALALGVFISTRATSQRAAMLGALAGLLMPTSLLSGMIFPISSMPEWLQAVSQIVPATWFIEIARGIMLKGVGLEFLWQETLVVVTMALALTLASIRSFGVRLR